MIFHVFKEYENVIYCYCCYCDTSIITPKQKQPDRKKVLGQLEAPSVVWL